MEYFNLFVLLAGICAIVAVITRNNQKSKDVEFKVKNLRAKIDLLEAAVVLISQCSSDVESSKQNVRYFVKETEAFWQKLRDIGAQVDSPKSFRKFIEPEIIRLNKIACQIQKQWGIPVNLN